MGKPTEEELNQALEEVSRMREHGDDPHFVAKSMLNIYYRFRLLEKILQATERYLHSGQGAQEHTLLVKAINEYHAKEKRSAGEDEDGY
jgi:hypothetical protein